MECILQQYIYFLITKPTNAKYIISKYFNGILNYLTGRSLYLVLCRSLAGQTWVSKNCKLKYDYKFKLTRNCVYLYLFVYVCIFFIIRCILDRLKEDLLLLTFPILFPFCLIFYVNIYDIYMLDFLC